MNVFAQYREVVIAAIEALIAEGVLPDGLALERVSVEPPRDESHGDLATNAAMVLAKPAGQKPRELAERLRDRLQAADGIAGVDVAGPGFINLTLTPAVWQDCLRAALEAGPDYGRSEIGQGRPVNVEYVSANPTGPLHIGHVRGAVFGDALANLLAKAGFSVCKEYYINDAGVQIDVLARSVFHRYREALGEDLGPIEEGLYPGDYLVPVGQALAERDGPRWRDAPESEWLPELRRFAVDAMMDLIRADLARLGVEQEVFSSEQAIRDSGAIDEVLAQLEARDLIYVGTLEPPKGKLPEDWEERPQTLFRSTAYGDDIDRPLKKSDGNWTYFAPDIAYHNDKVRRGFDHLIDVLGADHGGYVKRMKAAVAALTEDRARLDAHLCQMVRLFRDGEPVKMSKRAGDFITLEEVVDEVGRDVVRFIMLTRKNDAPLDFDYARVVEQSKENPVFYVQYAHARVHSVRRNLAQEMPALDCSPSALAGADLGLLRDEQEQAVIRQIGGWPRTVEAAAQAREPHRIAFFLYDLASRFHALWNKGNDRPDLRFIRPDDPAVTLARAAMITAVATVIASGLQIMGVQPAEEMR